MGFGHLYVDAGQAEVIAAVEKLLAAKGMKRIAMTAERHPTKMKEVHETELRLMWISPRLGRWTGIFEFRYYANENRERWGYTDEALAAALSKELRAVTYRMEVLDGAGFWLWSKCEGGGETDGGAYQDNLLEMEPDPAHPRYALNRIIEREGMKNVGLGYENIPGPEVAAVQTIPQRADGIEGLEGFVHLAFHAAAPAARL
jgi:hypothetical protein